MRSRLACLLLILPSTSWLDAAVCEPDGNKAEKPDAEQKIVLLERMTTGSLPAQRVMSVGSDSAKALLDKARSEAAAARSMLGQGCFEDASKFAAQGLATVSAAFRATAQPDAAGMDRYRNLLRQATSLFDTVENQGEAVSGLNTTELSGMRRQIARAEQLALHGEYTEAASLLAPIADRLERRLFDVFDKQTLVYKKEHGSPADEYAYLLEYYRGYRLLLSGVRVSEGSVRKNVDAVAALLSDADASIELAEAEMSRGRWGEAIVAMQNAIEYCERASRISGLQY